jgi:hypothetical protein
MMLFSREVARGLLLYTSHFLPNFASKLRNSLRSVACMSHTEDAQCRSVSNGDITAAFLLFQTFPPLAF